jgi:hypothetical protein
LAAALNVLRGILETPPFLQSMLRKTTGYVANNVVKLVLTRGGYKSDAATRHDTLARWCRTFIPAFNVGTDDKHIAPIDEAGVALAAIQGLNEKSKAELKKRNENQKLETENAELKRENAEMETRLGALRKLLTRLVTPEGIP